MHGVFKSFFSNKNKGVIKIIIIAVVILLAILLSGSYYREYKNYKRKLAQRIRDKFSEIHKRLGGSLTLTGVDVKVKPLSFFLKLPVKTLLEIDSWDDNKVIHETLHDYHIIENAELQVITT